MKPLSISQAAEHYAGTGLTRTAIRRAILTGEIPSVRAGRKYLITLEGVEKWLGGDTTTPEPRATLGIRPVSEV